MAEHTWVLESLASYLADGLEPREREELEQHLAQCPTCALALDEVRSADALLVGLFAEARPAPGLEDRAIQRLRQEGRPPRFSLPFAARALVGLAAVLLLMLVGAGMTVLIDQDALPLPREWATMDLRPGPVSAGMSRGERRTKTPDQLVAELHGGRVIFADSPDDRNLENDGRSISPDTPSNHDVGRVEETTVPGPVGDKRLGTGEGPPPGFRDGPGVGRPSQDSSVYYSYRNDGRLAPPPATPVTSIAPAASAGPRPADSPGMTTPARAEPQPEPSTDSPPATLGQPKGGEQPRGAPVANQEDPPQPQAPDNDPARQRKIIRSGEIEFEVDSFDAARKTIAAIAAEEQGFIATVNSEKLENGKVHGTIVVRVPPEHLDRLLDKLRALGELKNQRIGSLDVTKQFYDLESRLRAARAMEQRLLDIIKTGKGEIKDLIAAERELGTWRTKIEEFEGELRYYNNLISLSTLTIVLVERSIRSPYAVKEVERIDMGIEVEDVEKAQKDAHQDIAEAKGRIIRSELKQHGHGLQALILFEVSPEAAGPLRDRLKQYGVVTRLEADRQRQAEGGSGRPQDAKVQREDVHFQLTLNSLATINPRETVLISIACVDAVAAFDAITSRAQKLDPNLQKDLNRQPNDQTTATIRFSARAADADAVLDVIRAQGEVLNLRVVENAEGTTRSKRGFEVKLVAFGAVQPRETQHLFVLAKDVPGAFQAVQQAVSAARGRILHAQLNEQDRQNITAQLDVDVRRSEQAALTAALAKVGDTYARRVERSPDTENTIDSKVLVKMSFLAAIAPRETAELLIVVGDVEQAKSVVEALVADNRGKSVGADIARDRNGQVNARLAFDVPLHAAPGLIDQIRKLGLVRVEQASRDPQVPESELAIARLNVTLANDLLVPRERSVGQSIHNGLSYSIWGLTLSLTWLIVAVLVLLPWAALVWGIWKLVVWLRRKPAPAAPAS